MNNRSPKFSILLPTHNREDVLSFAIKSVLAQTEPDFELLIVADGCNDSTRDVISQFKDSRIRVFDLPKAPHFGYANRNIALRESRGNLIAFAAHDDLLLPDHLELMEDLLIRTKASWGYSRPLWVSTDGFIVPFCTNLNLADEHKNFINQHNTIPASCVVHTRSSLERAGYWPENIPAAADWALWKRMIADNNGQLAFLRQPTTLHFSAVWKRSRHSSMGEMQTFLSIADQAEWWPDILYHPPNKDNNELINSEQAILWSAIESGQRPWISALREAVDTVIDRITWSTIREILPQYETMRMSRSWRLTQPLRSMMQWLRRLT